MAAARESCPCSQHELVHGEGGAVDALASLSSPHPEPRLDNFIADCMRRQVYGVECSSIIEQARQIISANGFAESVTLIKGRVEEIELPVKQVDIIISEWMGYFLLYESMLDTVLFARDKWLVEGGLMLPDKTVLNLCAIEDAEYKAEKIDCT